MQLTEVDGVTTIWEVGPPPLTGALMFGVGTRHETFRTAHVAHVVEHLVMSTMPKSHLDSNARVDADTTVFHATGPAELVTDFLSRVCAALTDLPLAGLAREAGVIEAEEGLSAHPALCWAAGVRFGSIGPGMLGVAGPGASQLTEDHVRTFVAANYVRDNAVLILTGPPPHGLRLGLPTGPARPPEILREAPLPLPALISHATPHPTLSVVLPNGRGASVVFRVLVDRVLDDVRHSQGVAYDVGFDTVRIDAERALVALYTDGKEEHAEAIVGSVWRVLRELAEDGPTEDELAHDRGGFRAYLDDPRNTADWLEGTAYRHLQGEPLLDREQAMAQLEAIDATTVRHWAASALATALVGVPHEMKTALPGLPDRTEDERPSRPRADGERFPRRPLAIAPRDLSVSAGGSGLSQTVGGHTVGGTWTDVVGVACAPRLRLVLLADGTSILLWHKHLRNADRLFEVLRTHVPEVHFDSSEEAILDEV